MYDDPSLQLVAARLQAMGFVLPKPAPNPAMEVLRSHFAGVTFSWRDVSGDLPDEDTLARQFGDFSCEAVLALLQLISRVLQDMRGPVAGRHAQRGLVDWMLPTTVAAEAHRRLAAPGNFRRDVIFHHEQLLAATSLAILHGNDGPPEQLSDPDRHRLGVLLLQLSVHLSVSAGTSPESDEMLGHTVRLMRLGSSEALPDVAARHFELFAERAAAAHAIGRLSYDVGADFLAAYDIDPVTFMGMAVLNAVPWVDMQRLHATAGSFWEAGRSLAAQLEKLGLRRVAETLLIADRDWFRQRLVVTPLRAANYLPLYERTLLRMSDGGLMPTNWRLMMERAFGGIYWTLHDLYRKRGGQKAIQAWVGALGRAVYEPYVHDRLRSIYSGWDPAQAAYRTEDDVGQYRSAVGEMVDGADGYLREGRTLVVIDITASAIPATTLMSGDGVRVREAMARLLLGPSGKFRQLNRVIGDLFARRLALPGVNLDEIDVIIPVLITASAVPQFPTIRYHVRQAWQEQGLFGHGERVLAPQLMSFEELEMLEASLEQRATTLSELLVGRQPEYDGDPLKNFLIATNRDGLLSRSPRTDDGFHRFQDSIRRRLAEAGLPDE